MPVLSEIFVKNVLLEAGKAQMLLKLDQIRV